MRYLRRYREDQFFQGVRRILLSTEEGSECAGTGYQIDLIKGQAGKTKAANNKKRKNI
jgi:hypothetical protein